MAPKPHANTRKRRGGISPDAVIALVEALPEVQCRPSGKWSGIKVRGKGFGYLSEQDEVLLLKATLVERAALIGSDPKTFMPSYESGESGWVEIVLRRVDPEELAELVTEAWRMTAPKTLVAAFDNQ